MRSPLKTSLDAIQLEGYVRRLLSNHLPDGFVPAASLKGQVEAALDRVANCFSHIHKKYYEHEGTSVFDHLNGDHFATFLYFLSNSAWRESGDSELPTRLFYLNKIMHGLDLYFSVPMPDIFMLVHPVGTVLGKADYGNYLVVYQNCTVGAVTDVYPRLGEGAILYSQASVIGNCKVGDNVVFGANALILDLDVPSDTVVLGQFPDHKFKPSRKTVRQRCFEASP